MDSITIKVSPESTRSPGLHFTCHTVPVISDLISMRGMICGRIAERGKNCAASIARQVVPFVCAA
jgi:hypothetical protein